MPYVGNHPAANFASVTKDTFSGNASTTAFTLSKAATTNGVAVFVENVRQIPTTAYSVSGTTLTFTAAPPSGTNNIYVLHHNAVASTANHPASQDLTAVNGTMTGTLAVTGTSTLTGATTVGGTSNLTITDGDLVIGTSGHGIDFSATGDGSGTDSSELLDDYEEGTWTPTATAYGGTFSASDAQYVKVGRMVHFDCVLSFSGTDSDRVTIAGLPYTATNTSAVAKYFSGSAYSDLMMLVSGTTIVGANTSGDATYTSVSGMTARFSGTYMATA